MMKYLLKIRQPNKVCFFLKHKCTRFVIMLRGPYLSHEVLNYIILYTLNRGVGIIWCLHTRSRIRNSRKGSARRNTIYYYHAYSTARVHGYSAEARQDCKTKTFKSIGKKTEKARVSVI